MPLTLKIKYFNTFILREEPIVTTEKVVVGTVNSGAPGSGTTVTLENSNALIENGMTVHGPGIIEDTICSVSGLSLIHISEPTRP